LHSLGEEVAKVKKRAVVTGVRNVKASKKASKTSKARSKTSGAMRSRKGAEPGRKAKAKPGTKPASAVRPISKARGKLGKAGTAGKARIQVPAPVVRVTVKPLEPQAKCGSGTSVQHLFRVDETVNGCTTTHLVFYDRHGWYCEHGRNCPAVGHAKKYQGHIARAS
jgi:hypothetical protein